MVTYSQTQIGMPRGARMSLTLDEFKYITLHSSSNTTSKHAIQVERNYWYSISLHQRKIKGDQLPKESPIGLKNTPNVHILILGNSQCPQLQYWDFDKSLRNWERVMSKQIKLRWSYYWRNKTGVRTFKTIEFTAGFYQMCWSIKEWHLQTLLCSVSRADHLLQSPHSVADLTLIYHYYFHSLQFQQHPHFQGPLNDHHPVQKFLSGFDLLSNLYWSCSQTSGVQYQNLTQRSNYSLGLIALQAGWCSMHPCTGNLKKSRNIL